MRTVEFEVDMETLVDLMRGAKVVVCGKDDEGAVTLYLNKKQKPEDMDEALMEIETIWENYP